MAGKRVSFATMAGAPVAAVPGREDPHSAPIDDIAPNPDNPRDADDFEDAEFQELKKSLEEVGQLQPVLVASRKVYLAHFPHHTDTVGGAKWVVLGGNRRLEAARQLGWKTFDIKVRDDLGSGEGALDEAVMIENIHRKNIAPLKEAAFLQRMVERHGSQVKVAKRIGKTQAYVSQRIALLRLAPELQAAVESGELKVKEARGLAAIDDHAQQVAAWKGGPPSPTYNPVMAPEPSSGRPEDHQTHNRVMTRPADPEPSRVATRPRRPREARVPEQQRPEAPAGGRPTTGVWAPVGVPWHDPHAMHQLALAHMTPGHRAELAKLLAEG